MKELFNQIVMRLALCGLAASFAVLAFRSWPVRAALARLSAMWRGLTAFGRFAVCAFLFVGVLEADKTNNVNNLPPLANDWADSSYEMIGLCCRQRDILSRDMWPQIQILTRAGTWAYLILMVLELAQERQMSTVILIQVHQIL